MKKFLEYFRPIRKNTAQVAKERLQIIVAHERSAQNRPDFLNELRQELVNVVAKYIDLPTEHIKVDLEHDGDCSILELNVTIPDTNKIKEETDAVA